MPRQLFLSSLLSVAVTGAAIAGDTVTINMPGGATQTVSAGVVGTVFNELRGLPVAGSGSTISSITQDPVTGSVTFTTSDPTVVYTTSSGFIIQLLMTYCC